VPVLLVPVPVQKQIKFRSCSCRDGWCYTRREQPRCDLTRTRRRSLQVPGNRRSMLAAHEVTMYLVDDPKTHKDILLSLVAGILIVIVQCSPFSGLGLGSERSEPRSRRPNSCGLELIIFISQVGGSRRAASCNEAGGDGLAGSPSFPVVVFASHCPDPEYGDASLVWSDPRSPRAECSNHPSNSNPIHK
jgi:hypothetical protein